MKNLVHSLSQLAPFDRHISHRAAVTLLSRQYALEHPVSIEDADAELAMLFAADTDAAEARA
jgi:hypothetical protein